jgi:hypothetical protein
LASSEVNHAAGHFLFRCRTLAALQSILNYVADALDDSMARLPLDDGLAYHRPATGDSSLK